jgi:two-component system, OmpR family, KDP operon response regulator KdpE
VTPPIRVLVVDDEPAILHAVQTVLETQGYAVSVASTGERALARAAAEAPELVILDLGLPGIDGMDVIRQLRSFAPRLPILILSAHGDDASKVRALDLGADDYVSKPFSVQELLARIRTALRHGQQAAPLEASHIERGDVTLDLIAHQASCRGVALRLTPTQFDLLACFCRHANRVLTHRMLLAEAWGDPDAADSTNVRMFVSQLRRRLAAAAGHRRHIETDPGVGYRFVPQVVAEEAPPDRSP